MAAQLGLGHPLFGRRGALQADLSAAEAELAEVRREMEAAVDAGGGHIDQPRAEAFTRRLEAAQGKVFEIRGKLRDLR